LRIRACCAAAAFALFEAASKQFPLLVNDIGLRAVEAQPVLLATGALTPQPRGGNRETMKNITVSLDDETYRRARMIAAQRDTSVSALVKRFLNELGSGETEFERLRREEQEIRARITSFSASENVPRDELYDRHPEK